MKPTKDDIRRRLGLQEVPKPPDDLMRRLKADIPPSFRYTTHVSTGRKNDLASSMFRGMSWQVAASFLALTIVGVGIYMVAYETHNEATATIAEADRSNSVEFAPPTEPSAAAPKQELSKKMQDPAPPKSDLGYDIPASPPPPPARLKPSAVDGVERGVEGGVEGGVVGGVVGGIASGVPGGVYGDTVGNAPSDSVSAAPAVEASSADKDKLNRAQAEEAQHAKGRNERFAEEKETRALAASAPAAGARPAQQDGKSAVSLPEPVAITQSGELDDREALRERADRGEPLRVGGRVRAPVITRRVELIYPEAAKDAGVQGVVIIEAIIDSKGNVKSVKVLKPLPLGLDEAAVTAVKQWKFKPGTLDGKPVDVTFILTVNAKLER